jgi:signal transduction histidine kinase/putative methionine-R-sulfoxide reductase with GAF domain
MRANAPPGKAGTPATPVADALRPPSRSRIRELEQQLAAALARESATGDVLRTIASSPSDIQPVFDMIGLRAEELCNAEISVVAAVDGELIRLAAVHGATAEGVSAISRHFPMQLAAETVTARTIRSGAVVEVEDALADSCYEAKDAALAGRYRSCLGVPMRHDGRVIGSIFVARADPGRFDDAQVHLLRTFAEQAVIAVRNVRTFSALEARNGELSEALERQIATSEILGVISRTQADVQPVFETIARAALELCRASSAVVAICDGQLMRVGAVASVTPEGADSILHIFPRVPSRDNGICRAVLTAGVVTIPDILADPDYRTTDPALAAGFRSVLAVPLLRAGHPIGAVSVGRTESGPFSESQIALLKAFADQAVIAIENVRLFNEVQARTLALKRSVDELRALREVGQAVSSTLDLETVLHTIVRRATELVGVAGGAIYEYDEAREEFRMHATHNLPDELAEALRATPIAQGEGLVGRLAVTPEPVQVADLAAQGAYQSRVREILLRVGSRSLLAVPLLRESRLLGGLVVNRDVTGEFGPQVIELLQSFATQSALAIQNARLFREIEIKGRELEAASRHKSEFLANMSHELRTPLNAIIGFSEVLAERMFGEINDKQAEYLADIQESGRHLLSLINDILDLSKIEAGRMELDAKDFDLRGAIENTLTLVRERAHRRGIALALEIDPSVATLHGDERKVKQVLLNLLSNALKFTPEGGRIDVRARVDAGMFEVAVSDTGIGIAPEDQQAVFEEFRQVGAADRKVEGTGLGLALSRKFIELHGGTIGVTSQPGAGSTFSFTLPRRP